VSVRPQGLRVCCPKKPDWGVGHVLSDDDGAMVTVFFLGRGKQRLDTRIAELDLVTGPAAVNPVHDPLWKSQPPPGDLTDLRHAWRVNRSCHAGATLVHCRSARDRNRKSRYPVAQERVGVDVARATEEGSFLRTMTP